MSVKRALGKLALLSVIALLATTALYADNVVLASLGSVADPDQTNSFGKTIAIDPNAAWASALGTSSWVSFTTSGNTNDSNYVQVANGTVTRFFDNFTLAGTPTSGWIEVMADDSTSVFLNGHLLLAEAPTTNNTYATCSDFDIGCRGAYLINFNPNDLVVGNNVLEFDVAQRAGVSYGLDYYGEVDPTSVPEPSSLLLLGSGTLGFLSSLKKKITR
jgi:hypothetical protein